MIIIITAFIILEDDMDTSLAEESSTPRPRCNQTAFSLCRLIAVLPRQAVLPAYLNPPLAVMIRQVPSSKKSPRLSESESQRDCSPGDGGRYPV
jgi:hypothetical protein